jgi:tyrosinase
MSDLETPWVTPEGVTGETEWFGQTPFVTSEGAFGEAFDAGGQHQTLEAQPGLERAGMPWPESPFEVPVGGLGEDTMHAEWEAFTDAAAVPSQGEDVAGCGGPVSDATPLLYRGTTTAHSRNPWVGRAQTLLNVFLQRHRSGTENCADNSASTKQFIVTLRAQLGSIGQDPLVVDCKFGVGTETATKMLQACRGLVRDGKIGDKTWPELLALTATPKPSPGPARRPDLRVREDVWTLSASKTWHPTLHWYAKGVQALQALNGTTGADPRCWRHLAETHGSFSSPASRPSGARWKQCEHFSWHFLPWHRAYLHHFEKIMWETIVGLGGPTNWALPFWNYSDTSRADVRSLPPAFRTDRLEDGSPNPLLVPGRGPKINDGARISPTDVDTTTMFARTSFSAPGPGLGSGFGGTPAPVGSHRGAAGSQGGALEETPHGNVHVAVGGPNDNPGLMTLFETAALDPIFWLHHANIDRLWEAWRRRRSGNTNPTATAWLNATWVFGAGTTTTTITTRELLDPRQAPLGYRYSDMPVIATPEAEFEGFEEAPEAELQDEGRPPELVGASSEAVPLGPRSTTTRIALGAPAGPAAAILRETGGVPSGVTVYLRLENITATVIHTSGVVVYVNIPPGGRPADFPDRKAGVVSMFGVIETSRTDDQHTGSGRGATFDITRIARALGAARQWDPAKLDVTFVPIPDATGQVGAAGDVKVGRVSVFYA